MKKMIKLTEKMGNLWKRRICSAAMRFRQEEAGASEMVVVVVLIIIVLAAAALFREQLLNVIQNVFNRVTGWING